MLKVYNFTPFYRNHYIYTLVFKTNNHYYSCLFDVRARFDNTKLNKPNLWHRLKYGISKDTIIPDNNFSFMRLLEYINEKMPRIWPGEYFTKIHGTLKEMQWTSSECEIYKDCYVAENGDDIIQLYTDYINSCNADHEDYILESRCRTMKEYLELKRKNKKEEHN